MGESVILPKGATWGSHSSKRPGWGRYYIDPSFNRKYPRCWTPPPYTRYGCTFVIFLIFLHIVYNGKKCNICKTNNTDKPFF